MLVTKVASKAVLLFSGKRKTGKAEIKRRETERKTRGKGSQGKGKTRSQKKTGPGKTRKAGWKGEKRERESGKEGEGRKRTTWKEGEERWRKKKAGWGKKVSFSCWRVLLHIVADSNILTWKNIYIDSQPSQGPNLCLEFRSWGCVEVLCKDN